MPIVETIVARESAHACGDLVSVIRAEIAAALATT